MGEPQNSHLSRAVFFYERKRYEQALSACLEALAETPEAPEPLVLAGWCCSAREDWPRAEEFAKRAVLAAPDHDGGHALLAVVADHGRRFEAAEQHIQRAIALSPENHLHRVTLGYVLVRWGRVEEAITAARQGLALDPGSGLAARALATFYRLNDEPELAERYAVQALAAEPEAAGHHLEEGLRLLERGKHQGARRHFLESLRLDPADGDTFETIAHETVRNYRFFKDAYFPPRRLDLTIALLASPLFWYLASLLWSPLAWVALASLLLLGFGYLRWGAFVLCRSFVRRRLRDGRL